MSGRGTSPRPRITVSQPDDSSGKEGDVEHGDRQLLEDLMSLVHLTNPVRCYHCHAKFNVPLDAIRHQFLDHVNKEMCLLVPVIIAGRLKHRATHYGKSPEQIYTSPSSTHRQSSAPEGSRPGNTTIEDGHSASQPNSPLDSALLEKELATPRRMRRSRNEKIYGTRDMPAPRGLIDSPPGSGSVPYQAEHRVPDSSKPMYATLPRSGKDKGESTDVTRRKRKMPFDKSKRHTISSPPDGFDLSSAEEPLITPTYLRESFYTLPRSYEELMTCQDAKQPVSEIRNHVRPATSIEHNLAASETTPKILNSETQMSPSLPAFSPKQADVQNYLPVESRVISMPETTPEKFPVDVEYMRVKFGAPLSESLKDDILPPSLVELIVYIAKEGVTTTDLFRRPGNPTDLKVIMKKLAEGKEVTYTNYNFYTIASVIKKFLLKIPGGIFGPDVENQLLEVLQLENRMQQYDRIHSIISSLPNGTQQLLALLFGTWFRIVNHSEYNTMSSEAVAKSVAGSLFHTCADDPHNVEKAVRILQILIDDYGTANMFGRKNLKYFAEVTRTGISVKEKYRYEFRYPEDGDPVSLEKYYPLYASYLEREAKKRGFHPQMNAITEEEFYGSGRSRTNTRTSQEGSMIEIRLQQSSSPSPQSLQPHSHDGDSDFNPHKKLTHVSSLSAPEVNQVGVSGCNSPTQENLTSTKRMYLSTSLSRFDNVRRRQILRMKKRSNWFLSPNTSVSMADSESLIGSREASVGKSSLDATSSDALASDVTASDGGLSDTPASDAFRLSSDTDCTFDESSVGLLHGHATMTPGRSSLASGHTPLQRLSYARQDVLNANHGLATSTPIKMSTKSDTPTDPGQHTPQVSVSEKDVRYFMVENYYGSQQNGDS